MRKLIITAVATVALSVVVGGSAAFAVLGQSHVASQRAAILHNLSAHHIRSLPLWIPG
jgi:hypothetical protein